MRKFRPLWQKKISLHQALISNFSHLTVLQLVNILTPLIVLPFLIRKLGSETYGLLAFSQAIVGYLVILINFGFDITATQKISVHRTHPEKVSEIVSSVFIIKGLLLVLSFLILAVVIQIIPQAREHQLLFYLTSWMGFNELVLPIWYFQGIEQMRYITHFSVLSRLSFMLLLFFFISGPEDYLLVPVLSGVGILLGGIYLVYVLFFKHNLNLVWPGMKKLKSHLKDSLPVFFSNVSTRLYISTNKVLIGAFVGYTETAYYDLAEKIVQAAKTPQKMLGQVLFPKLSNDKNIAFVRRLFTFAFLLNVALTVAIAFFSEPIAILMGGYPMRDAATVLSILIWSVPFVTLSNFYGLQVLVSLGHTKTFSRNIVVSGFAYFVMVGAVWIFYGFSLLNLTVVTTATELLIAVLMFYSCRKASLINNN